MLRNILNIQRCPFSIIIRTNKDIQRDCGRNFATTVDENATEDKSEEPFVEKQEVVLADDQIEAKRNKSRLNAPHWRKIHGEVPYPEPAFWTHHTVKYKRMMYARYGEKCGENPGIMWPTKKDLEEQLDYERIAYPYTIQEVVENCKARRQEEQDYIVKRYRC